TPKKFQTPFGPAPSPSARRRPPAGGSIPSEYEKSEQSEFQNRPRRPGLGLPLVHKPRVPAPLRFASPRSCVQSLPDTLADFPGSPLGGTSAPALPDLRWEVGRILRFLPTQLPFSVVARRPGVRATEPWKDSSILRDPVSWRLRFPRSPRSPLQNKTLSSGNRRQTELAQFRDYIAIQQHCKPNSSGVGFLQPCHPQLPQRGSVRQGRPPKIPDETVRRRRIPMSVENKTIVHRLY